MSGISVGNSMFVFPSYSHSLTDCKYIIVKFSSKGTQTWEGFRRFHLEQIVDVMQTIRTGSETRPKVF